MNGTIISSKVDFSASPISVQVDDTQEATAITPETTEFKAAGKTTDHAAFNYSAIVIPQTVTAGNFTISFKVDGTDYIWTSTSDVNFVSGNKHQLSLLVGKDVVQVKGITATPWGKENITQGETD